MKTNHKKIIATFLLQFSKQILFKKVNRIKLVCDELTSYEFGLKIENQFIYGAGVDQCSNMAYLKAVCECLERIAFYFSDSKNINRTTNGFSVHTTMNDAQLNSELELIERDAFFTHYLLKKPFACLNSYSGLNIKLPSKTLLQTYRMETYKGYCSFISKIVMENGGIITGLGVAKKENESVAIEKSIYEALLAFVHFSKSNESLSKSEFYNLDIYQTYHHVLAGINNNVAKEFSNIYFANNNETFKRKDIHIEFKHNRVNSKYLKAFEDLVYINVCHSNELQGFILGPVTKDQVRDHISISETELNSLPIHIMP